MKNSSILTTNSLVFLQSQPEEAHQFLFGFEVLQKNLLRTINLLGKRLYDLTMAQADLTEIGKAQRALAGSMATFHKTLATLGELQRLPADDPYCQGAPAPDPYPQTETTPQPTPEPELEPTPELLQNPIEEPQPQQETAEEPQPDPPPPPPDPPHNAVPPDFDFDKSLTELEQTLQALQEKISKPKPEPNPEPQPEAQPQPNPKPSPSPQHQPPIPKNLSPPKKYNTRRKRKDPKYLRKLQKRHAGSP